eukprot:gene1199-1512_t
MFNFITNSSSKRNHQSKFIKKKEDIEKHLDRINDLTIDQIEKRAKKISDNTSDPEQWRFRSFDGFIGENESFKERLLNDWNLLEQWNEIHHQQVTHIILSKYLADLIEKCESIRTEKGYGPMTPISLDYKCPKELLENNNSSNPGSPSLDNIQKIEISKTIHNGYQYSLFYNESSKSKDKDEWNTKWNWEYSIKNNGNQCEIKLSGGINEGIIKYIELLGFYEGSSFQYPSNFVSTSAVDLLSRMVITILNSSSDSIVPVDVIEFIDKSFQDHTNTSTAVDSKLCLLDFIINLLQSKNLQTIEYLVKSNLINKSCSLLIDSERMVRERVIELLSISIKEADTNCGPLYKFLFESQEFFRSIIETLFESGNKGFISTSIELVGVLESTFIFPPTTTTSPLFRIIGQIVFFICEGSSNNSTLLKLFKNFEPDHFLSSLLYTTFLVLQRLKKLPEESRTISVLNIFGKKWLEWIVKLSILDLPNNPTQKNHKLAIQCLSVLPLKEWIHSNSGGGQDEMEIDNYGQQKSPPIYKLLKNMSRLSRVIVKQTLDCIFEILTENQQVEDYIESQYQDFPKKMLETIISLLMNPNSDIREVGLSFLGRIFQVQLPLRFRKSLFKDHQITGLIIKKLVDSDSYVRSSALEIIKVLSSTKEGWDHMLAFKETFKTEQLHITSFKEKLDINDNLLNNNQINLDHYTKLIEEEKKQHNQQHHHYSHFETISNATSDDNQSLNGDNQDWEWDDEEFQDLMKRNYEEEPMNFLNEGENLIDQSHNHPEYDQIGDQYPFPYTILLFFSDDDSFPRM